MSSSTNLLLQGHQSQILALKYSPSGNVLASGGMDRSIFLWSPALGYQNSSVLKSHTNAITSLCFSPQSMLISASADKTVCVWDVEYEKLLRKFKGHTAIVHGVSSGKGELVVSVGDDNTARLWDVRTKTELWICKTKYPLTAAAFSANANKLFVGGVDNQIKVLNVAQQSIQQVIQGHQDTISCLDLSPDGTYLMSNSFDQTIKVWDIRNSTSKTQRFTKSLSGHLQGNEKGLIRGSWSHDGLYISCGSIDRCVYIWDVHTKKIVQRLGGHTGTVNEADMTFFNNKSYLATCSNDRNIIVSQIPDIFL